MQEPVKPNILGRPIEAVKGREGGSEARAFVSAYDVGLDEPMDGGSW